MQQRNSQNITPDEKPEVQQRHSLQQQANQEQDQEQVTPQTIARFNQICLDATQVMTQYKNQSMALKYEIADLVSVYEKSSANTEAVPVEKIISITNEYEQGMREANREYHHLEDQLKNEEKERNQIVGQIKDCFDKLERMEQRIREKKKREAEAKRAKEDAGKEEEGKEDNKTQQKKDQAETQIKPSTPTEEPQKTQEKKTQTQ